MFKKIKEYFETKRKIRRLAVSTLESLSQTAGALNEVMQLVHAIAEVYKNQITPDTDSSTP